MARAGRKRKSGHRHASGDIVRPERAPDDRVRTSRQPHRRGLPEPLRLDERAESALGRCNLRGIITDAQYDAGCMYATIVGAYRAVIEGPRATAGSGRGYECNGEACLTLRGTEGFVCGCEARKDRYDAAFEALIKIGQRAAVAVAHVAIHGREPAGQTVYLVSGLDALARHFGLRR